jgi:general L-amino acid transport system permease protein
MQQRTANERRPPLSEQKGPLGWMRANLFNSIGNSIVSVLILLAVAYLLPRAISWAFLNATTTPNPEACREVSGACWGFINEKLRLMIFGTYPYEQQWRPLVAMIATALVTFARDFRGWWLLPLWLLMWAAVYLLMRGGWFALTAVETEKWGGLPLTLILSINGIIFSFPLAIMLALGRRSELPIIKALSVTFIELVRGVPLITVLFMASLMIPLFLPEGLNFDKVLRAQIGFILFAAAYEAEVIRGGLQAIPRGQGEAADALGLSYWHKTGFIILPQALKLVIPPLVNTFIGFFKDTSLVIIIGLFDLLGATRLASNDSIWRAYYVEGLIVVALIYFAFCYGIATYSRRLEAKLNTSR